MPNFLRFVETMPFTLAGMVVVVHFLSFWPHQMSVEQFGF